MFKTKIMNKLPAGCLPAAMLISCFLLTCPAYAAPSPDLWPRWQVSAETGTRVVDHSPWQKILTKYLVTNHPSGINRFRYGAVAAEDRRVLNSYLSQLQQVTVSSLNRAEQKSYWINLYNALTVKVILDHYPVQSIMDTDISPGFFSNGPWDAGLLVIEGRNLSLNDIEHRILRPIFADNRVHYGLNCASLGCPNLQLKPFSADNTEQLLDEAAREYINHPRGAEIVEGKVQVSSIYKWFQIDFGGSEQKVIDHLLLYAQEDLAKGLRANQGKLSFDYDWNLNE